MTVELHTPSPSELLSLCAADSSFFARTFFPETVREQSPPFHAEVWKLLESSRRKVNIQMFRGSAKTSLCRIATAKRIAFGQARTVLYIGLSQDKAAQSIRWIKRQIEFNRPFAETFQLSKGSTWQDVACTIESGLNGQTTTLLGYGVTGSIRGVNIDDYRPDYIVLDDICDEENTATPEQRAKISSLVYGALDKSLAPQTESPDAKLVMLQTPLNREDVSTLALRDPGWVSAKFGCWTPETRNLPVEQQKSAWESRYTTEFLQEEKKSSIARNQISVWNREMEVRITSPETSAFKAEWLKKQELMPERRSMRVVIAVDPTPPPTEVQVAKSMHRKDFEVFAVVGNQGGNYYLLDYSLNRGHTPNWTTAEFFRLGLKWRPEFFVVETVAYQKTLAWILSEAMKANGIYFPITELRDKRSKFNRIVDELAGPASQGAFFVKPGMSEFTQQFTEYPDIVHDDVLDAVSMAMMHLSPISNASAYIDADGAQIEGDTLQRPLRMHFAP